MAALREIASVCALVLVAAIGSGCNGPAFQEGLDDPERRLALHVKFRDSLPIAANPAGELILAPVVSSAASGDAEAVKQLQDIAERHSLVFEQAIQVPDAEIVDLMERAKAESGEDQPDLRRLFIAHIPDGNPERFAAAAGELQENPAVEYVDVVEEWIPPPGDIPPPTLDLVGYQSYRWPDPGIDAKFALEEKCFTGLGVRLSDCEYGWNTEHEDLNDLDIHAEPGQTVPRQVIRLGWEVHGTAVLGITSAVNNAYGCTGIAPGADVYIYPEQSERGDRRLTAITNACVNSAKGDIVLLEMQTTKHWNSKAYGPAELDHSVFLATSIATAAGIVVVAAAGNGSQDLDSEEYAFYRAYGETKEPGKGDTDEVQSGAILVGAGTADTTHDRHPVSTYGKRIDLQGWGEKVFTLGYGNYDPSVLDVNQHYTIRFGHTSAAAAMVAGACAVLQEAAVKLRGAPLSPRELRDLMVATGTPAQAGSGIGPLPDLKQAIEELERSGVKPVDS